MRKQISSFLVMYLLLVLTMFGCVGRGPRHYNHVVMNRMTPVKNQGANQTCWIYAMLAAIETEQLRRGDSVNLSPYYIAKLMEQEPEMPLAKRGMGATAIQLIGKYGIVDYDAMPKADTSIPLSVWVWDSIYTPTDFALRICAPDDYIALTSNPQEPYDQYIDINLPDNWLHDRFMNIPMDSLLARTERAVRQHHGVCWESQYHAMAIVGIARDVIGRKYFIMKNSWGSNRPYNGLDYLSFKEFKKSTLAVEIPRQCK